MNPGSYLAIIFARFSSKRLPGKVLFPIGDTTVLGVIARKLHKIPGLRVVVATSSEGSDDPIESWCNQNAVQIFRGNLENVSARAEGCLSKFPCEAFFRVNGDSPFLQIGLMEEAIRIFERQPVDLVTNILRRTFPYGIAVELICTTTFLTNVARFMEKEQEHITSFFYEHADEFSIQNIENELNTFSYRFVIDTPDDWNHVNALYQSDPNVFNYSLSELVNIVKRKLS